MATATELVWYARRLARMSPAELAHRLREQARRREDKRRSWTWNDFGADVDVSGLPGLARGSATAALASVADAEAARASRGQFGYLGQAWPAPSEPNWWLTDFWFIDPVTGRRWPGAESYCFDVAYRHEAEKGDVKFVWELNRLQFLQPLALSAARGTVHPLLPWEILGGWMERNPPFRGVNWTSGIECASRIVSALSVLALLGPPPKSSHAKLGAFCDAHAYWLSRYPSLYSSANNHRVSEIAALFLVGLSAVALRQTRPAAIEASRAELEAEIQRQFHDDGVGAEQSPTYAAYSLEWFCLVGVAAETAGRPMSEAYRARAEAAAKHLRWIMDDGGAVPAIGDDDEGRVLSLRQSPEHRHVASVVALAERWLGRSEIVSTMRDVAMRDLLRPAPPRAGNASPHGVRTFPAGGYSVARQPRAAGDVLIVFDHAPLGFLSIAAHGHADALALWLHWGDEPVLVDAGTYLYHSGGPWRDAFRSTPAHNTLAIEGRDQSRISGAFAWSAHARTRLLSARPDLWEAEHDGYRREFGLTHRRVVDRRESDVIQVVDRLVGRPRRPGLAWRQGFTIHPDVKIDAQGAMAILTTAAGRRLSLECVGGDWTVEPALYSPRFNCKEDAQRLVQSGKVGGDPTAITRIRFAD